MLMVQNRKASCRLTMQTMQIQLMMVLWSTESEIIYLDLVSEMTKLVAEFDKRPVERK